MGTEKDSKGGKEKESREGGREGEGKGEDG